MRQAQPYLRSTALWQEYYYDKNTIIVLYYVYEARLYTYKMIVYQIIYITLPTFGNGISSLDRLSRSADEIPLHKIYFKTRKREEPPPQNQETRRSVHAMNGLTTRAQPIGTPQTC